MLGTRHVFYTTLKIINFMKRSTAFVERENPRAIFPFDKSLSILIEFHTDHWTSTLVRFHLAILNVVSKSQDHIHFHWSQEIFWKIQTVRVEIILKFFSSFWGSCRTDCGYVSAFVTFLTVISSLWFASYVLLRKVIDSVELQLSRNETHPASRRISSPRALIEGKSSTRKPAPGGRKSAAFDGPE